LPELRNRNFVYYPAQIWPHKNHLMLIDALARYRDDTGGEMVCVLTGRDYGHWAAVREHIASYRLQQVHYLGLVPFPQLIWLYRNCRAVLALGMHESSSLPVREGAAFGKALICLDIPPNREAAASLRLKLVDRTDPSVLARALMALAGNSEDVVGWSAENARLVRSFDWRNIARAYELVLQAIVAGRALPNVHNR
jgi:glycosyltransferase involved in cell wall biosynthesis